MRDRRGTKKSNTVVQDIVANPTAAANAIFHCDYGHFGVSPFHTISSARSPCGILFTALGNHPSFRRLGRNTVCAVCLASSISQALTGKLHPIAAQTQPFQPLRLQIHSCTDIHPRHLVQHRRTRAANGRAAAGLDGLTWVEVCLKPTARKGVAEMSGVPSL